MILRAGMDEGNSGPRFQLSASAKHPPSRKADRAEIRELPGIQIPWNGSEEGNRCSQGKGKLHTQLNTGNQDQWGLASLINISKWPTDGFQNIQPSSSGCVLALAPGSASSFWLLVLSISFGSAAES